MRHFLKMKLLLLMALLLAGYGSMWADNIPTAVVTTTDFANVTYTWTDASNNTHTSYALEKATDPYQIYELMRFVYQDQRFPGPTNKGYSAAFEQTGTVSYSSYLLSGDFGWNVTGAKPTNCGYTLIMLELTDETKSASSMKLGEPSTKAKLITYLTQNVKSAQVIPNGIRVGTYANHTSGTLFNVSGTYNRFYFISKGKLGTDATYRFLTAGLFEDISPVPQTASGGTDDFYEKMSNGSVYRTDHDCISVIDQTHYFNTDALNPPTMRAFSGLTFFLPDYRMTYWSGGSGSVSGRDDPTSYKNYHPTYAPATFLYTVRLEGEAYDSIPNDNQYWVNLNWISSFDAVVGETVDQKYNLYIVNEDGSRTLVDENLTQDMLNQTIYGYWVEQRSSSYTITYVVSARPVGSNGEDIWEETWSNEVTVLIPGLNPDEKFTLKLVDYYSDFDVDNQRNKYINKLSLSEDIAYGLKAGNLREGANNFDFHRAGGGNDRVFARLTLTSTGSLNTDPSLSLSNPAAIVGEGSTTVTVRGWNLTPGSTVTVTASNGFSVSPTTLTVSSDGSLNATVTVTADGTQASGTVTVSAATDSQTATTNVTWSEQPQVTVDAPTFTPPAGNYQAAQSVTIASATSGATIYYSTTTALTADNYSTAGTVYSSAIAVGEGTTTIYAIAVLDGTCSAPASATYVVTIPSASVATPVINPNGGTDLTSAQTVTITCTTSGATIYYTTDGSTPSASNGTQYTGSFTVSTDCTVKAIAVLNGTSSEVASATFTFTQASGDDVYTLVTDASTLAAGDEILIVNPNVPYAMGEISSSGYGERASVTITDNKITLASTDRTVARFTLGGSSSGWTFYDPYVNNGYLSNSTDLEIVSAPGTNSYATIFISNNNATIRYTTGSYPYITCYTYNNHGFWNSSSVSNYPQIFKKTSGGGGGTTEQVATPTFSPAAGTYSEAQNVTISCATSGATIYYTTDGTTPTTSSAQYSSAITVSSTMTVKAIAVKSGMTNSEVASALYTITPAAPTFNPDGGSFSSATDVTITGPAGSTINWTFTTTEGTATSGSGTSPVTVNISASGTLSATATVSGSTSNATTATYTVTSGGGTTQVFAYDGSTASALPTGWSASSASYYSYDNEIQIYAGGNIQSPNYTFSTGKATVVFTVEGSGTMTVLSSKGSSSITMPGWGLKEYTVVLDVAGSDYIKFIPSAISYMQKITIYDGDLTASRFAPRRAGAAGAAAVQRAAASSITVTPTWTYVTNASENPEYLQIDASKTTTFTGTAQTYTDAETVISVMNMFASGSYFYDQFAASTAENNHPDSYTYYVRFAEAVGVTDSEGITSNDVTVPVYKANSKIGGSYTKAECDADTVHGYDVSDAIDASIQVQNNSEIYYYELSRRMTAAGTTEVVGSYQRMQSGDYQDMITGVPYDMPASAANMWIDKTDAAIQPAQEAFYVPRAVTLHRFGENVNGSAPGLNNYGGPITPAFLGSVDMALTNFYGAVNDANHTNPVDSAEWTYNGKRYCYYNVELTVNPDEVLEGKDRDDTYELYKYRVWRVLADGNYNEILGSRKFREKGDYLFDEVNIREEKAVWPSYYNNRGDYPIWTTAGRTLNGEGLDDNGNGPEASGTFGGRLATTQADALPVTFIARLYYRSKSVNNTQNNNKAPRMAGASDEGGNYYYIVEKRLDANIYRDANHTSVDGVTVAKEVESVKFYNVAGMESDKPFEGVNIVVTRYTDGTTSSQKVLK